VIGDFKWRRLITNFVKRSLAWHLKRSSIATNWQRCLRRLSVQLLKWHTEANFRQPLSRRNGARVGSSKTYAVGWIMLRLIENVLGSRILLRRQMFESDVLATLLKGRNADGSLPANIARADMAISGLV